MTTWTDFADWDEGRAEHQALLEHDWDADRPPTWLVTKVLIELHQPDDYIEEDILRGDR